MQVEFIKADSLFASVQEDLSSYDANNELDPGRWYPWIRKVVSDLGISCFEYKHALVWIKNYTSNEIPCDFYILDSAFWVSDSCCSGMAPPQGPIHYQGKSIIWQDTTTATATQTPDCPGGDCNFRTCAIETFDEVTVREYVQGLPYTYSVPIVFPLRVNERLSKGWCLPKSICFGARSMEEININKGEIFTNFPEGIVLLNYYAYPYDEDGLPMIPKGPKFQLALEHYIKWKAFENMWINNDDMAAEKKMLYFKNEFQNNSYPDAEYTVKLTSAAAMMDLARNNRNRFNHFQLIQK